MRYKRKRTRGKQEKRFMESLAHELKMFHVYVNDGGSPMRFDVRAFSEENAKTQVKSNAIMFPDDVTYHVERV